MKKIIATATGSLLLALLFTQAYAQPQPGAENPAKRPHDWWQADWKKDSIPGISLDEAYDYLKGRKSKTVVVAILDNCVDTAHEDLKNITWINKKEIAGNGIDDDNNGYIDDTNGWCFVCGKNNVSQYEESRIEVFTYKAWRKQFENIDTGKLTGTLKIQYAMYQLSKQRIFDAYRYRVLGRMMQADTIRFMQYLDNLSGRYKDTPLDSIPFDSIPFSNAFDSAENIYWTVFVKEELNPNPPSLQIWTSLIKTYGFAESHGLGKFRFDTTKNFRLIVGDDDNNFTDKYGAPTIKVQGHDDRHATAIAGVIAANRQNNIGIKGIAGNALVMPVIIGVRDKDLVFAIHYAVDNGASIINISIGGSPSIGDHIKELTEAYNYAREHGVLIVHAAGNEGVNMDNEKYDAEKETDAEENDGSIIVGATTALLNDNLVSFFSNYGEQSLDLFAPGSAIYTTLPGNLYGSVDGTSLSCPIVVGVAALLKSYFPSLTAKQLKEILMKSVYKPEMMVIPPMHAGVANKIPFSKMSKSGGIVNAYNAVKLADEMMKKK